MERKIARDIEGSLLQNPYGVILIIGVIAAIGLGIVWIIFGGLIFAALALVFWQTLLPGLLIFIGLVLLVLGGYGGRLWLALFGLGLMVAGFLVSIFVG